MNKTGYMSLKYSYNFRIEIFGQRRRRKAQKEKTEKESCCETETGGRYGTDIEGSISGPRGPKK